VELVTLLVAFLFSDDKKQWHAKHMSMKVLMDLLPQALASLRLEGVELDEAVLPYLLPPVLIQVRIRTQCLHPAEKTSLFPFYEENIEVLRILREKYTIKLAQGFC
jgi:hypothetical protein